MVNKAGNWSSPYLVKASAVAPLKLAIEKSVELQQFLLEFLLSCLAIEGHYVFTDSEVPRYISEEGWDKLRLGFLGHLPKKDRALISARLKDAFSRGAPEFKLPVLKMRFTNAAYSRFLNNTKKPLEEVTEYKKVLVSNGLEEFLEEMWHSGKWNSDKVKEAHGVGFSVAQYAECRFMREFAEINNIVGPDKTVIDIDPDIRSNGDYKLLFRSALASVEATVLSWFAKNGALDRHQSMLKSLQEDISSLKEQVSGKDGSGKFCSLMDAYIAGLHESFYEFNERNPDVKTYTFGRRQELRYCEKLVEIVAKEHGLNDATSDQVSAARSKVKISVEHEDFGLLINSALDYLEKHFNILAPAFIRKEGENSLAYLYTSLRSKESDFEVRPKYPRLPVKAKKEILFEFAGNNKPKYEIDFDNANDFLLRLPALGRGSDGSIVLVEDARMNMVRAQCHRNAQFPQEGFRLSESGKHVLGFLCNKKQSRALGRGSEPTDASVQVLGGLQVSEFKDGKIRAVLSRNRSLLELDDDDSNFEKIITGMAQNEDDDFKNMEQIRQHLSGEAFAILGLDVGVEVPLAATLLLLAPVGEDGEHVLRRSTYISAKKGIAKKRWVHPGQYRLLESLQKALREERSLGNKYKNARNSGNRSTLEKSEYLDAREKATNALSNALKGRAFSHVSDGVLYRIDNKVAEAKSRTKNRSGKIGVIEMVRRNDRSYEAIMDLESMSAERYESTKKPNILENEAREIVSSIFEQALNVANEWGVPVRVVAFENLKNLQKSASRNKRGNKTLDRMARSAKRQAIKSKAASLGIITLPVNPSFTSELVEQKGRIEAHVRGFIYSGNQNGYTKKLEEKYDFEFEKGDFVPSSKGRGRHVVRMRDVFGKPSYFQMHHSDYSAAKTIALLGYIEYLHPNPSALNAYGQIRTRVFPSTEEGFWLMEDNTSKNPSPCVKFRKDFVFQELEDGKFEPVHKSVLKKQKKKLRKKPDGKDMWLIRSAVSFGPLASGRVSEENPYWYPAAKHYQKKESHLDLIIEAIKDRRVRAA